MSQPVELFEKVSEGEFSDEVCAWLQHAAAAVRSGQFPSLDHALQLKGNGSRSGRSLLCARERNRHLCNAAAALARAFPGYDPAELLAARLRRFYRLSLRERRRASREALDSIDRELLDAHECGLAVPQTTEWLREIIERGKASESQCDKRSLDCREEEAQ